MVVATLASEYSLIRTLEALADIDIKYSFFFVHSTPPMDVKNKKKTHNKKYSGVHYLAQDSGSGPGRATLWGAQADSK